MASSQKIRVAVLYGGRSGEHQIALQSAASVIKYLDANQFEIIPIGIDPKGRWHLSDLSLIEWPARALPVFEDAPQVLLPPNPSPDAQGTMLVSYHNQIAGHNQVASSQNATLPSTLTTIDVVFPVMHGPLCEDGTIQGLLELADIPYVGCDVLSSALAMDKDMAKRLFEAAGIPTVPYIALKKAAYSKQMEGLKQQIQQTLGFPCFVKPANLGSSVGVTKITAASHLDKALEEAFRYDEKVLIEKAIDAREIEIALLENEVPGEKAHASVIGEIVPHHDFYSYEAKYVDPKGASLVIPAEISEEQQRQVTTMAQAAFDTLECEGMARVDFFLDRKSGLLYLNEMNTIPGFTSISMYPKLWEASGLPYQELLTRLIKLALLRHKRRQTLVREFHHS